MARVFNAPRYEGQTGFRVKAHLDLVLSDEELSEINWGSEKLKALSREHTTILMGNFVLDPNFDMEAARERTDDFSIKYQLYAWDFGMTHQRDFGLMRARGYGKVFKALFFRFKDFKIRHDYDGMVRLMAAIHRDKDRIQPTTTYDKIFRDANVLGRSLANFGILGCNLGKKVFDASHLLFKGYSDMPREYVKWKAAHTAFEQLKLLGGTAAGKEAHRAIQEGHTEPALQEFSIKNTTFGNTFQWTECYKIGGMTFIANGTDKEIYILDHSSIDQVLACSNSVRGMMDYALNYRLIGDNVDTRERNLFYDCVLSSFEWVFSNLERTNYSDSIARVMKMGQAIMLTLFHDKYEKVDLGAKERALTQMREQAQALALPVQWQDFLKTLPIPERRILDLSNCYHILPAPDMNLALLERKGTVVMKNARQADPVIWQGFMKYVKATDFCKYVTEKKQVPAHRVAPGYTFEDKAWFKSCKKGKYRLPPEDEQGNVWIYRHFEFVDPTPFWYMSAADVTHVNSRHSDWLDRINASEVDRDSYNELLYAMAYAPLLSKNIDPVGLLKKVGTGQMRVENIVLEAGKCENTKPGAKVRETWSASDVMRELTTALDCAARGLALTYDAVTATRSGARINRIFDGIVKKLNDRILSLCISGDISGWSPQAPRSAWLEHHDYVMQTAKVPEGVTFFKVWDGVKGVLHKRGWHTTWDSNSGLYQGFTAVLDTMLNVHMCLYSIRMAKRASVLREVESATCAALIDDFVITVTMDPERTEAETAHTINAYFDTVSGVFKGCGAEVDGIKTIISSNKVLFLNAFYCHGSEIPLAMKTASKVDRSLELRYASVLEQVTTVFGGYAAASMRGMCPIAAYESAMCRSVELLIMAVTTKSKRHLFQNSLAVSEVAFAPRSFGGWGFPTLGVWLTTESADPLVSYLATMATVNKNVRTDPKINYIMRKVNARINQRPEAVNMQVLMAAPTVVHVQGVMSPEGIMTRTILNGITQKCRSPIFKSVLETGTSVRAIEALDDAIRCVEWDASVLGLLGEISPSAWKNEVVSRITKNELCATIFPGKVRDRISRAVRRIQSEYIIQGIELPPSKEAADLNYGNFMYKAKEVRDRYYEKNAVNIKNHTIPDYFGCLIQQSIQNTAPIVATIRTPVCNCPDDRTKRTTNNWYDGTAPTGRVKYKSSVSPFEMVKEKTNAQSIIYRYWALGCALAAFVKSKGGDGDAIMHIFSAMWGKSVSARSYSLGVSIKPGTSQKRISRGISVRSHIPAVFTNSTCCVDFNTRGFEQYLFKIHSSVDIMGFVSAARVLSTIEGAAHHGEFNTKVLYFAPAPGTLHEMHPATAKYMDKATFMLACEQLSKNSSDVFKGVDTDILFEMDEADADEGDLLRIEVQANNIVAEREAFVAAGYVTYNINSLASVLESVRIDTGYRAPAYRSDIRRGDELIQGSGLDAAASLRHISVRVRPEARGATLLFWLFNNNLSKVCYPEFTTFVAYKLGDLIMERHANWHTAFVNALVGVENQGLVISAQSLRDTMFPSRHHCSENVIRAVTHYRGANLDDMAQAAGILRAIWCGRAFNSATYLWAAQCNVKLLMKYWSNAAERYGTRDDGDKEYWYCQIIPWLKANIILNHDVQTMMTLFAEQAIVFATDSLYRVGPMTEAEHNAVHEWVTNYRGHDKPTQADVPFISCIWSRLHEVVYGQRRNRGQRYLYEYEFRDFAECVLNLARDVFTHAVAEHSARLGVNPWADAVPSVFEALEPEANDVFEEFAAAQEAYQPEPEPEPENVIITISGRVMDKLQAAYLIELYNATGFAPMWEVFSSEEEIPQGEVGEDFEEDLLQLVDDIENREMDNAGYGLQDEVGGGD